MSAILKNHNYGSHEQSSIFLSNLFGIDTVIIAAVGYPVLMLPACRFYILRKARGLTQHRTTPKMSILKTTKFQDTETSDDQQNRKGKNSNNNDFKIEQPPSFYWTDIKSALKFWSNKPILDAYFLKDEGQVQTSKV